MKKNKILAIMMATIIAGSLYANSAFAADMQNVSLQLINVNTLPSTNTINGTLKITNTGSAEIYLSDLKIRYYFTRDSGNYQLNFFCDYASINSSISPYYRSITGNVTGKFVTMSKSVESAGSYLEISFDGGAGTLAVGNKFDINFRFAKADWSNFDQSNDYSFNDADKIVVFYCN